VLIHFVPRPVEGFVDMVGSLADLVADETPVMLPPAIAGILPEPSNTKTLPVVVPVSILTVAIDPVVT